MTAVMPRKKFNSAAIQAANAVTIKDFAGLLVALVAVAVSAVLLLNFSFKQEDAFSLVLHTREVARDSQQLLLSIAKADMSARNLLFTKDAKYLLQFNAAKASLQNELANLTNLSRTSTSRTLLKTQLEPALTAFVAASDALLEKKSIGLPELQLQESAKERLITATDLVQQRQLKLLQERNDQLAALSETMGQTRLLTVSVAFVAIVFSIVTLQLVMEKDRAKIRSLEAEIGRTQAAEQVARDALAEADKSNRVKSEFMSNISHEIRTPMTGILGSAELLCSMPLDGEARSVAQILLQSSRQLLGVLNALLNFSKLQRNHFTFNGEAFTIRQVVEDEVRRCLPSAEAKTLSLSYSLDPAVPTIIWADQEKIRHVLLSLLSNAIKFTNEGGVQVSVDFSPTGLLRISVTDTGIGINDEGLKKLFLPFVQVDGTITRLFDGAGLGLFIAKGFVEIMSGEIGVLSEPGSGSIFWFTFATGEVNEKV